MNTSTDKQPEDYEDNPVGAALRWADEIRAANKALETSRNQGDEAVKAYLDERDTNEAGKKHWALFHSNTEQLKALLYGNTPKANVNRRFADAEDDAARVAGEMAERILHSDIEKRGDTAADAFGDALEDRLLPGVGTVRVRYTMQEEEVPETPAVLDEATGQEMAPAVPATTRIVSEDAPTDYVYWKDFLWSPARVWAEVTWVGFGADLGKRAFVARFGEDLWKLVPKKSTAKEEDKDKDPWSRVRVWELWHKDEGKVYWYVEGFERILDVKDDPLGLDGFFPCPKPMFANTTTGKLVPKPDYMMAKDLYTEINAVTVRINRLQDVIKAVGVYDKTSDEVKRLLDEAIQNELLPAENWGAFLEKGGIQGAIQMFPLDTYVNAMSVLRDYRRELVDALFQVTGQSDIMRGQATQAGASATEQAVKARFGSVRVQRRQDEFARFVSDAQALKLEIVSKHFQPQTILERSNAAYAFKDEAPEVVQQAVQLLKSDYHCYRVEVKPESVSLTDFAALKQERTEVMGALSTFFQGIAPIAQSMPGSMPFLLKMLQQTIAGLRGSSGMEGVIDAAIDQVEKQQAQAAANPQPQQQDPKLEVARMKMQGDQMKAQADIQKEQLKHQQDMERIAAETQAHDQQEQSQAIWNTREATQKALITHALKPPMPPGGGGGRPGGGFP